LPEASGGDGQVLVLWVRRQHDETEIEIDLDEDDEDQDTPF